MLLCQSGIVATQDQSGQSARYACQVTIPVVVPGRPVSSVSILSLHKSDMRLLHLAAKLGPVISEAAHQVAAAMAEQEGAEEDWEDADETGRLNRPICLVTKFTNALCRGTEKCVHTALQLLQCFYATSICCCSPIVVARASLFAPGTMRESPCLW